MDEKIKNYPIPIVIIAYNRPNPLRRLLSTLEKAQYPKDLSIPLIISIDHGDNKNVIQLANDFNWPFGKKEVITHEKNLGLRQHILKCGDITQQYASIIMLEDDLAVSPFFYNYTLQAIDYYKEDPQLAGISLYNYETTESTLDDFQAVEDGSDFYFMQLPSSWGQAWTSDQWKGFRQWLHKVDVQSEKYQKNLPQYIQAWSERSWKKWFISYMMENDKYFVFPRLSLSTTFSDVGENSKGVNYYDVNLQTESKKYRFSSLKKSRSIYDSWFEPKAELVKALVPALKDYDFEVDLLGAKLISEISTEWVLTTQTCYSKELSITTDGYPDLLKFLPDRIPREMYICRKAEIKESKLLKWHNQIRPYYYSKAKARNKLSLAAKKYFGKWF